MTKHDANTAREAGAISNKEEMVIAILENLSNDGADASKLPTKSQISRMLESQSNVVEDSLKTFGKAAIPGVVILSVAHKPAAVRRNPRTEAAVNVPAKNVVRATIRKNLKTAINS